MLSSPVRCGAHLLIMSCLLSPLSASDLILTPHSFVLPVLHCLHPAKGPEPSDFTSACHGGPLAPSPTPCISWLSPWASVACAWRICLCYLVVAADVYAPLTLQVQRVPEQRSTAVGIVAAL